MHTGSVTQKQKYSIPSSKATPSTVKSSLIIWVTSLDRGDNISNLFTILVHQKFGLTRWVAVGENGLIKGGIMYNTASHSAMKE